MYFMFQDVELKFQDVQHKFQDVQHKFHVLEDKIPLGEKRFSSLCSSFYDEDTTFFNVVAFSRLLPVGIFR